MCFLVDLFFLIDFLHEAAPKDTLLFPRNIFLQVTYSKVSLF